jgi:hypothetical protein
MTAMILKDFGLTWLDWKACRLVCHQWRLWIDVSRGHDGKLQLQTLQKVVAKIRQTVNPLISQDYPLTAYDFFRTLAIRDEVHTLLSTYDENQPPNDTFEKDEKCAAHFFALTKAAGEICLASRQTLTELLPARPQPLPGIRVTEKERIYQALDQLFTPQGIVQALALNEACDEHQFQTDALSHIFETSSVEIFKRVIGLIGVPATIDLICNIRNIPCRNDALANLMHVLKDDTASKRDSKKRMRWVNLLASRIKQIRVAENNPCPHLRTQLQLLAVKT